MAEAIQIHESGIPGVPRQHQKLPWRQAYVPSWYEPHQDMQAPVLRGDGTPFEIKGVQIRVGMIPPERRYALYENGMMLDQATFKDRYQMYIVGLYQLAKGKSESLEHYPLPTVENFLSWTEASDGSHKLVPIGYDPATPRPKLVPARPKDDEPVVDRAALRGNWESAPEAQTPEAEQAQLEAQIYQMELAIRLDALEGLYREKFISKGVYERKRRDLTGEAQPKQMFAKCGKAFEGIKGVKAHQRFCNACKAMTQPEAAPQEA